MKAGILEIGDVYVVNKADEGGAESMISNLKSVLPEEKSGWKPPVLATSASEGGGVVEVADALDSHFSHLKTSGKLREKERVRSEVELRDALTETMLRRLLSAKSGGEAYKRILDKVVDRKLDPHSAARLLLSRMT